MYKSGTTTNSNVYSVTCVMIGDKCGNHNSVQRKCGNSNRMCECVNMEQQQIAVYIQ